MKTLVLDGARLRDAVAVYRELAEAFGAPGYFGRNPDALWDAITDYHGEPVEIVWRDATQSATRLGKHFNDIVAVLKRAEGEGLVNLRLQ